MQADRIEDLSSPHGAAVQYLVSSVTADNAATTLAALRQFTRSSPECHRFVLRTVVTSAMAQPTAAAAAAPCVDLARQLVAAATERPNCRTLLAPAFDGVAESFAAADLRRWLEERLALAPVQQLQVAVALVQGAQSAAARAAATTFLAELTLPAAVVKEEEETLRGVAMVTRQAGGLDALEAQLRPACGTVLFPSSQRYAGSTQVSVAAVLRELGISCVTTAAEARELLSVFPHRPTERDVAEVLSFFAASQPAAAKTDSRTFEALMVASGKDAPKSSGGSSVVNPMPLLGVMQDGGNFDWDRIIQLLDQPGGEPFRLKNIHTIFDAYLSFKSASSNEHLPASLFFGRWANVGRQRVALEFMLKNPTRASRKALAAEAPQELLPNPKPTSVTGAEIELWRCIAFVEAAVHVASRDREFELTVLLPTAEKLPLVFLYTLLFGSYTATVKHFVIMKYLLQHHCPSLELVAKFIVPEAVKRGRLEVLINLLSEITIASPGRTLEVLELVLRCRAVVKSFLQASRSPRLVVAIAMCMDEIGESSDKWLQRALEGRLPNRGTSTENRFSVAMNVVEVAETLLEKQVYTSSATQALNLLIASPLRSLMKGVMECAKALLASTNSLYPDDVEKEAAEFFKAMCSGGRLEQDVQRVERLMHSTTPRDKQLYACIINFILDECNSIYLYPSDARLNFASFYGEVIARDAIPPAKLQSAWSIILGAIVKPPNVAVADFGIAALERIKRRIADWPQFCRALRGVKDLDFRVPGIMAAIHRGVRKDDAARTEEEHAASPATAAAAAAQPFVDPAIVSATTDAPSSTSVRDKLHTLDIGTLLTTNTTVKAPPAALQNQINFLIGNTDSTNLSNNVRDLSELLRPEYYEYFSDYLVVKRASLEPNNQGLYIELVSQLGLPDLDRAMRSATIAAVKRLLASEKISTENSERTLLRNLGSWLGCITLEKNIPVLQKDLDFHQLVVSGLREGKLLPVVSFVARVLSSCARSSFFAVPNPWTMAQLALLLELYQLPFLRVTLRFEMELLCTSLDTKLLDVAEFVMQHPQTSANHVRLIDVLKECDVSNSPDFKFDGEQDKIDPRITEAFAPRSSQRPASRPLQPTAEPFRPKEMMQMPPQHPQPQVPPMPQQQQAPQQMQQKNLIDLAHYFNIPVFPSVEINAETITVPAEVEARVAARLPNYRHELSQVLLRASILMRDEVRRASEIALLTAKKIVPKDVLWSSPEDYQKNHFVAGQAMCRSTASSLCYIAVTDDGKLQTAILAKLWETKLFDDQQEAALVEALMRANLDLCLRFLEHNAGELAAARWVHESVPESPPNQTPGLKRLCPSVFSFERNQTQIYRSLFNTVPCVSRLQLLLREVDDATTRHFKELESGKATAADMPDNLTPLMEAITPINAFYFVPHLMDRLFSACAYIMPPPQDAAKLEDIPAVQLKRHNFMYSQRCLPLLAHCVERGGDPVRTELTRHYFTREEVRFLYPRFTQELFKLRLIDIPQFDLKFSVCMAENKPQATFQFADTLITSIVATEKIVSNKAIPLILNAARAVSESSAQPTFMRTAPLSAMVDPSVSQLFVPSPNYTKNLPLRKQVVAFQQQWATLMATMSENHHDRAKRDNQYTEYLRQLQDSKLVLGEMLSSYFDTNIMLCVEHFANVTLAQERARVPPVPAHQLASNHSWSVPPPLLPYSPEPYQKCDSFHELITLMFRCSPMEREKSYPLLWRVLLSVIFVIRSHHREQFDPSEATRAARQQMAPDSAFIPIFQQQPYVRILNNLLMLTYRQDPSSPKITKDFYVVLLELQPLLCPPFAFGWLELVGHRMFITRCLYDRVPIPSSSNSSSTEDSWQIYCNLLIMGIRYLKALTVGRSITSSALVFFKAFMKLLLILLHDYQMFIVVHRQLLLNEIPLDWIQMINLILSATPPKSDANRSGSTKGDGSARVDQIPEAVLRVQNRCIRSALNAESLQSLGDEISRRVRENTTVPAEVVKAVVERLSAPSRTDSLLNAIVLLVAMTYLEDKQFAEAQLLESSALDFFRRLCYQASPELRYRLLCSFASQLSSPNNQTAFFSSLFFVLFYHGTPCEEQTATEEQIIRVLGEKTLIQAPHVWGLHTAFVRILIQDGFTTRRFVNVPGIDEQFTRLRERIMIHPGRPQGQQKPAAPAKPAAAAAAPA